MATFFLALIIVLVIVLAAAFAWSRTGWVPFSFTGGSLPGWTPTSGDISHLRFRGCAFRVNLTDGRSAAVNATPALNAMAVAYRKRPATLALPAALVLDAPLNPFSFTIAGFNDPAAAPTPGVAPWRDAQTTLTGYWKTI